MAQTVCPVCRSDRPKKVMRKVKDLLFLRCPNCSFQFIHPYLAEKRLFDDYYWTKEYTQNFELYIDIVTKSLQEKTGLAEKIIGRKVNSFLDIGCGNGIYLQAADSLGLRNLGTDIDQVNIEYAKSKGLNALHVALEDLPLFERFDFIHLKAVLHLVPDPPGLLVKVKSLLAPGGVVYIDVPNQGSIFSKLRMLRDRSSYGQLQPPFRRGAHNFRSLERLCENSGLRIGRRVFAYPGGIYYPILGMNRFYRVVFRLFSVLRISSMLGVYAVEESK